MNKEKAAINVEEIAEKLSEMFDKQGSLMKEEDELWEAFRGTGDLVIREKQCEKAQEVEDVNEEIVELIDTLLGSSVPPNTMKKIREFLTEEIKLKKSIVDRYEETVIKVKRGERFFLDENGNETSDTTLAEKELERLRGKIDSYTSLLNYLNNCI